MMMMMMHDADDHDDDDDDDNEDDNDYVLNNLFNKWPRRLHLGVPQHLSLSFYIRNIRNDPKPSKEGVMESGPSLMCSVKLVDLTSLCSKERPSRSVLCLR